MGTEHTGVPVLPSQGPGLTEEGGGGHSAVAAGHHDADARLHEGHRKIHDLGPLLVDGEGADGHVRTLVEDLG